MSSQRRLRLRHWRVLKSSQKSSLSVLHGLHHGITRHASVGEAVAEATNSGKTFPPPDWVRIATTTMKMDSSSSACAEVAKAVMAVSQGLQIEQQEVCVFRRHGDDVAEGVGESLSVWVPPKAMLLVSSMIGEALFDSEIELPMVLAEGLEVDGSDPLFFRCELSPKLVTDTQDLVKVIRDVVDQKFAAFAELNKDTGIASIHTTAVGRRFLESWLPSRGCDSGSVEWIALGGNSEYLEWISSEVIASDADGCGGTAAAS
eukprot:TRINITY_DN20598_c0_g1_i4.p1 TRINITY_DN20598_c0_g1~~TRINITY_DN20598_c0_g1_i4.p1  ORF type:complete len:260 (+),score=45.88 TRINITY_DN20598_c0_g1_i4:151-930(+)